ncbi:MAG: DUF6932 family protein [Janthinobacterium lividum]
MINNSIPDFDHNFVTPPHKGNPTNRSDLSPYICTSIEFCEKFSTSTERISILKSFLTFRELLTTYGMINGFQWIDGSFLENIEQLENRHPRDLDLVTIYWGYDINFQKQLVVKLPEFANPILSKQNYKLDHYPVDAGYSPEVTVENTRYWTQLFSHNRSGVWKGMLSIALNTPIEDANALNYLQTLVP